MSSYYPSFSCASPNGTRYNSYKDKNLIVVHFESGDDGEMDTFLGMDPIYTDNAYGTRRLDYGAKYNNVAKIRISVMKADGTDFSVAEVRDFLRWTTGSRSISYLDLSDIMTDGMGQIYENVAVSFLGRVTSVYQQKLDARTIGFIIEHTSVSPYAYSPIQYASCTFGHKLLTTDDGVLYKDGQNLTISADGVLRNGADALFSITSDGVVYLDNSVILPIYNDTDDLSDYIYMDTRFTNTNSDNVIIKNKTLYEFSGGHDGMTEITNIHDGEIITLSSGQFISSSNNRAFGNNFNFIWPKLLSGENVFFISGTGEGEVEFMYRVPIKIGDCAIDVGVFNDGLCGCGGSGTNGGNENPEDSNNSGGSFGPVTWDDILGKPTTISGYKISDAYTKSEVDDKLSDVDMNIDEDELDEMLDNVLE